MQQNPDVQKAFQRFDRNNKGVLEKAEVIEALRGMQMSKQDAEKFFAEVDVQKQGHVTVKQLVDFCEKQQAMVKSGADRRNIASARDRDLVSGAMEMKKKHDEFLK